MGRFWNHLNLSGLSRNREKKKKENIVRAGLGPKFCFLFLAGLKPKFQFLFRLGLVPSRNFYFFFMPGMAEIATMRAWLGSGFRNPARADPNSHTYLYPRKNSTNEFSTAQNVQICENLTFEFFMIIILSLHSMCSKSKQGVTCKTNSCIPEKEL